MMMMMMMMMDDDDVDDDGQFQCLPCPEAVSGPRTICPSVLSTGPRSCGLSLSMMRRQVDTSAAAASSTCISASLSSSSP
jgi:hypothetical protein